jgi:F-type H+-transporting ATPase subunit epsilon
MRLEILTIDQKVFDDDIDAVTVPAIDGVITILPRHVPLMTALGLGELRIRKGKELIPMVVGGGIMQVNPQHVYILADLAERTEDIDEAKAEEARRKAEKLLEQKTTEIDFAKAEASLRQELARLKLVQKYRPKKSRTPGSFTQ